jgi:hypothetical protein
MGDVCGFGSRLFRHRISKISDLYHRLDEKKQAILLQILVKQITVISQSEIIGHELHSPYSYLRRLVEDFQNQGSCDSDQVRSGSLFV